MRPCRTCSSRGTRSACRSRRSCRSRRPCNSLRRQQSPLRRARRRSVPHISRHQRDISTPVKTHCIVQPIVRRRHIVPCVVRNGWPLWSDSSLRPLSSSQSLKPLTSSRPLRPCRACSTSRTSSPRRKQSPLQRTHIRCTPNIVSHQRNIPRPAEHNTIRQGVVDSR